MSQEQSTTSRAAIMAVAILGFCIMLGGAYTSGSAVAQHLGAPCVSGAPCPTWEDVEDGEAIAEAFHILDRHGMTIAAVAGPARMFVPLEELPELLVEGYVAVEDRRFWETLGVDGIGIFRAAWDNFRSRDVVSGASTIPMQLVRTIWASELQEVGRWQRKLYELWLAPRLVMRLGREEVLETYLNSVYLGDGVHGVEAAARHYFGVPAESLSLAQIATLIGLTRTPERYHPRNEPRRARARRDLVLDVMASRNVIADGEAVRAAASPLDVTPSSGLSRSRSYVTAAITRELRRVAPDLVGTGGLRIRTTVDPAVQAAGEEAIESGVAAVEAGRRGRLVTPLEGARLQAAGVALDPASGAIRAVIGGRDFQASEHDRAVRARRPVGSLVKPILLAAALEDGAELHHSISAEPVSFAVDDGWWTPDDHVEDRSLPLIDMIALSSNHAAVRLGRRLGIERLQATARSLGMDAEVPSFPSAFLGAFDAALLDVVSAYAPFENGGYRVEPFLIQSIHSRHGQLLYSRPESTSAPERALTPQTSFLVLQAMRQVVAGGTGWRVREFYQGPAAGKTGTSDGGHDAWFVGVTPNLAAGVWMGYDLPAPITADGAGGTLAAPSWGDWMSRLDAADAAEEWSPPPGVNLATLHERSGRLFPGACNSMLRGEVRRVWVTERAPRARDCVTMDRVDTRARLQMPDEDDVRRDAVFRTERVRPESRDPVRRRGRPR